MSLKHLTLPDGSTITEIDVLGNGGEVVSAAKQGRPARPSWLSRAYGSNVLHDFRNEYKTLDGIELLQRFTEVLSSRYFEDSLAPGIHASCVSHQPGEVAIHYVAIHRYPRGNKRQREVVVSAKASSLKEALTNVVDSWFIFLEVEKVKELSNKTPQLDKEDQAQLLGSPFGKEPVALPRARTSPAIPRQPVPPGTPTREQREQMSIAELLQASLNHLRK